MFQLKIEENNSITIIFHLLVDWICECSYYDDSLTYSTKKTRKMIKQEIVYMKKKCLWLFKHWRYYIRQNLTHGKRKICYFFHRMLTKKNWLNDKHFSTCRLISGKICINLFHFLLIFHFSVWRKTKEKTFSQFIGTWIFIIIVIIHPHTSRTVRTHPPISTYVMAYVWFLWNYEKMSFA